MRAHRLSSVLLHGGLAAGLIAILAGVSGCGKADPQVDFSRGEVAAVPAAASTPSSSVLRIAVAPVLSALPTSGLYDQLAEYLAQKLDRPVELVLGKTYAEINDLIRSGEVAVAFVCTNPYVEGREDFGMELLVVPQVDGETVYYSLLIAGPEWKDRSLADLRGETFAFSDPLSNSGRLAPVYELARLGESPDTFFERTIFTYSHDSSIRAVAQGVVTAAAVDSLVFSYMSTTDPETIAKVEVLERWGPYGISPVVVHPRLEPQVKAQLRDVFLGMAQDAEGRVILDQLAIDRFVPGDDGAYDSVRKMRTYIRNRGMEP